MHVILCLMYNDIYEKQVQHLIKNALAEDIGDGDHYYPGMYRSRASGKAILRIKEEGILAGVDVAEKIFAYSDHFRL